MAGGGSASSRPRYAPEDPTLPKPWRALVDGNTGYLYYWNPETNVTQYERPADELPPPPPLLPPPPPLPPHKSTSAAGGNSVLQADRRHHHDDDDRYGRPRNHQHASGRSSSGHGVKETREPRTTSAKVHAASPDGGASSTSIESYRRQNEIFVTGDNVPAPFMTFESTGFPTEILKEVNNAGFTHPTPIQAQSWPIALQGRDVVAIAKTGSGKTLGYLFPGFINLKRLHNNCKLGPTMLILAPTRELATQIQEEAVKFGRSSRILCTCLYGGTPKGPQLRDLDRGVDIVVATPGRLNDILEMKRVSLRQVSYLVLDEADRMLDMGFEPQIRKIVKEVPHRRQTLMFTATWPKEVRKIAADLLVHPVQVNIGRTDELVANSAITQYVDVITPVEKQRRLEQILRSQDPGSKVIVFCSTKRMCDQLARTLTRQFNAAAIHGDKSQAERDRVLNQFRAGRSPILVATDVAARGLDIKDIRVVINYDFPTGIEDYVHRIGRTGRAGATGVSYTFFCEQDSKYASDLVKVLEGANQRVPKELRDLVSRGGFGGRSRRWSSRSDARDSGFSQSGRNNSNYNGKGAQGFLPLPGRSDTSNHGTHHEPHERSRARDSDRARVRSRSQSRSRSRSRSHSGDRRNSPSLKRVTQPASPRSTNHGHTQSRSLSQSPSRSHSRDRRYSPSLKRVAQQHVSPRSGNHSHIQSRSRSRSPTHGFDGYVGGAGPMTCVDSPVPRRVQSPTAQHTAAWDHSAVQPEEEQQGSQADDGGNMIKAELRHSPAYHNETSKDPYSPDNGRVQRLDSPRHWHEASPIVNGNSEKPIPNPTQLADLARDRNGEEEEEGMIAVDEEGMVAQEEGKSSSKSSPAQRPGSDNCED